ncbi:MAG: Ig-like domain-containing protein [Dysgonamonadaceae bacterium]|jgi:uncharacterized protein (TIGR02145 family)|nr:Ig-like domain-containing protein [Dysgonamonadaceae bacterium]
MKMTKKTSFLILLFLIVFGTANLYAQVTIGSDDEPHSGAILDLRSDNKGLKLPTVSLEDVAEFKLSADATGAEGMMVYNTNNEIAGGNGIGIYIWSGKWTFAGKNAPVDVPVSRIVITSEENVNTVRVGDTLRLTARVLPDTASNQKLAWRVLWSSSLTAGKAVVNDAGLVTGIKPGSVTVQASAIDGSGAIRDFALMVLAKGVVDSISVYSENGQDTIEIGRGLQLIAAIEPESAYQIVKWEVSQGPAYALVNEGGLVTGVAVGTALIKATTLDGTALADSFTVSVSALTLPSGIADSIIGSRSYKTYDFDGTVWMVENSQEGTAAITTVGGVADNPINYYYSHPQKETACPAGWQLPTEEQCRALMSFLSVRASAQERTAMLATDLNGRAYNIGAVWEHVGTRNVIWTSGNYVGFYLYNTPGFDTYQAHYQNSVRCVKAASN